MGLGQVEEQWSTPTRALHTSLFLSVTCLGTGGGLLT